MDRSSDFIAMDFDELFSTEKSPRRELQGPRPPPLRVRKDSHKIRKPPVAPAGRHSYHPPAAPPRQPVIIYAVSPKVIHTDPNGFMALVQRLTGPSPKFSNLASSSPAPPFDHPNPFFNSNGAVSPAARYATMEKAAKPHGGNRPRNIINFNNDMADLEVFDINRAGERSTGSIPPGILSPGPASLHPIPATFFSPPSDGNPLSFLHDFSPAVLYNNKSLNFAELSILLQSPTPFISPRMISPLPSMDLFNNFFDL